MAHEIATAPNGRHAMMYVRESPWHGLGTRLDFPPTSADAIRAAGLDYDVVVENLYAPDGAPAPMARCTRRDDGNRPVLGVVGTGYRPIQNRDAFDFLDGMVANGELRYETAGALGIGERVWMLAKMPGCIRVGATEDVTEKYLLMSNAHDGSGAARVLFTPVRVVCANTLSCALRDRESGVKVRHTGDVRSKLDSARHVLGLADQYFADMQAAADRLASVALNSVTAASYFEACVVMPDDADERPTARKNVLESRAAISELFETGAGADMPGVRGTLWAAYNAVTEYVDHVKPTAAKATASLEERRSTRADSVWFGAGAMAKRHAFAHAMAMAN